MNLLPETTNMYPHSITELELRIHMGIYYEDNNSLLMGWGLAQLGKEIRLKLVDKCQNSHFFY